jgi:hypothetical protein
VRGWYLAGLAAVIASASGCGASPAATAPSASQFKAGPCHQVALKVLDIASAAEAIRAGSATAVGAEGRLTADQGQLAAIVGGLAGGPVQGQARSLVSDLGLFRFTLDHGTYNGMQVQAVATDVAGIESGCVKP